MKTVKLDPSNPWLKVNSSRWITSIPDEEQYSLPQGNLVRVQSSGKIPLLTEDDPADFDTPDSLNNFERFHGLFPWGSHPYNFEAWFEYHLEISLLQWQEFEAKTFEYLGHTFKPVYSFEADNDHFPFPFATENQSVYPEAFPISNWKSSDFWQRADEAELGTVKVFLMDEGYYILPTDSVPCVYVIN
jgi:hypothetical protein